MARLFIILTVLTISVNTYARTTKLYLKYGPTVDLPAIGVRLHLFKNISALPSGSMTVRQMTRTQGGKKEVFNVYNPIELWKRDQTAGIWVIKDLVTVTVYTPTLSPSGLNSLKLGRHNLTTLKTYTEWKERNRKANWNPEEITTWLNMLTGKMLNQPKLIKKYAPRNTITYAYTLSNGSEYELIYAISPKSKPNTPPIVIEYTLGEKATAEIHKNRLAVLTSLSTLTFYTPKKNTASSKARVISTKTKKNTTQHTQEYIDNKNAIISSIQNMKNWWYMETDNYLMVSNIKNKTTVRTLAQGLERSRRGYVQYYPLKQPLKAVSVARMFQTREEYLNFVGDSLKWTGGVWMPSKKELVVSPTNWGDRRARRKMMVEVSYHEAFHQYIYFATGERTTSAWFNEGSAQFFEGMEFKGKRIVIGIEPYMAKRMLTLGTTTNIKRLLYMSYKDFYNENTSSDNYALSHGLLFFLQKGAQLMKYKHKNNYHEIPTKYYNAILDGKSPKKATDIAWEGVDMNKFTEDFQEFWNSKTLFRKACR